LNALEHRQDINEQRQTERGLKEMIEKKQIDQEKAREVLERLDEVPEPTISARQFIIMNFDKLAQSGKAPQALHHFLLNNGIDVGTYASFRAIYTRVKHSRERASSDSPLLKPVKVDSMSVDCISDAT
jgi:glutamate/tyrosine decarboxylase-like PLP-dependent enzyme